jgi:glyoxylase-like metal-dependent hydrolase (beta-lactamase superfamily II)
MSGIEIFPIPFVKLLGRGEKAKFTHLNNFGQDVEFGYYAWYLEDDGKKILIDAGGTAEMALGFGRPKDTVTHIQTLTEGLAKLGVRPADIDIVILTHLHLDHVAYVKDLVNATFYVQADEVAFAKNPHPTDRFYDFGAVEGLDLRIIEGDAQITTNVRVILTPGHTVGGQSVVIGTAKGTAVVTGFCCIHENFEPGEHVRGRPPVIVPGIHHDVIKAYDSMMKVKGMADIIIANHDVRYTEIERIP